MYWKSVFGVAVQDILLIVKVHFTSKSKILAIYVTLQFMNFEALHSLWSVSFLEIVSKSKIYQLVKKIQYDAKCQIINGIHYAMNFMLFMLNLWRRFAILVSKSSKAMKINHGHEEIDGRSQIQV